MSNAYEAKQIKIRAIKDWVLISDMNFGERKTSGGIILKSDDGKTHGIRPRWGKVYCVGPEQQDISVGQWILIEHGRWTRKMVIDDGDGVKNIHRVDVTGILAVSDEAPGPEDELVSDSM